MEKYKLNNSSLRKILDYEKGKIYSTILPIDQLPDLDDWMKINPRGQNLNTALSKKVSESLFEQPLLFVLKNRGLTLMAQNVRYDNRSEVLSFELDDEESHGLLDGGHTYRIIKEYLKDYGDDIFNMPMIRLEIIESDDIVDEERVDIVKARNSSTQVKDDSIANLNNYFDKIKEEVGGEEYADHISYKENDLGEDMTKKPIAISEILSYLKCFDQQFGRGDQPIIAYSGKGSILKKFANDLPGEREKTECLIPLLKDILKLHDKIYLRLPDWYNSDGGKFGRLTGVIVAESKAESARKRKKTELQFIGEESGYRIPAGYIYPLLAAFRANLKDDGTVGWKVPPEELLEAVGPKLASFIGERALALKNPNQLGKDKSVWQLCYQEVLFSVQEWVTKGGR